jgi:hypothetical protein
VQKQGSLTFNSCFGQLPKALFKDEFIFALLLKSKSNMNNWQSTFLPFEKLGEKRPK